MSDTANLGTLRASKNGVARRNGSDAIKGKEGWCVSKVFRRLVGLPLVAIIVVFGVYVATFEVLTKTRKGYALLDIAERLLEWVEKTNGGVNDRE